MIESKLEKLFVDKFKAVCNDYGLQIIGTLQPTTFGELKAEEEKGSSGVLVVKIFPREYATPTVPTCTIRGSISLSLRADVDFSGNTYLDVCEAIMNEMERLQKCAHQTHGDYSIPSEGFDVTGFQLGQGDTGINQQGKIFTYLHQFTVLGVIREIPKGEEGEGE